jgi:Na+/H+ antiporter NhaC
MAILFPLVVPLAHEIAPGSEGILLGTVSSILAGSVWGDHCSPISDTTILSSMATSCDHMDHVRTQLPYCLAVGLVSLLCAEIPVAAGWYGPWTGLAVGATVMIVAFELISQPVVR